MANVVYVLYDKYCNDDKKSTDNSSKLNYQDSKCDFCGNIATCHIQNYTSPDYSGSYKFITRHFCSSCSEQGMYKIQEQNRKLRNYEIFSGSHLDD